MNRCGWAGNDPLMVDYHDKEWGAPVHVDQTLFEFIILEGAQAGLSWKTILNRREGYRAVFAGFDPVQVASFSEDHIQELLTDPRIIRNKRKVQSAVQNAKAFLNVQEEHGSFDSFIWEFVDQKPIINQFKSLDEVPATTELSTRISKALKKKGFSFVGPTIVYAYMQSIGMVNDHLQSCFRYEELI